MKSRSLFPLACALLALAPLASLADAPAPTAAAAAPAAKPVNNIQGKIASLDATAKTITVTSHHGANSSTFAWDDATKIYKTAGDVITDLKVGDTVRVSGSDAVTPATTALTAKRIMIIPALETTKRKISAKTGFHRNGVDGVVAATSPALTVTTPGGVTVTVNATPETRIDKETLGATSDLFSGVTVQARLKKDAPSPLATTITIVTPRR